MPSLTIENYVKIIYQTCAAQGERAAATGQIAAALGVSPGSVTSMLKTLSESSLAQYTPYEGVRLTESGRHLALRIVRRHRLIELFLVRTLDFTWDEVHDEAENMEHAVSDLLVDRIDRYLGYPTADPHGDPIPTSDGQIAPTDSTALSAWEVGETFRLVRVIDQTPGFLRYLGQRDLGVGTVGRLIARQLEGSIVTIQVDESEHSLALAAAEKLLVCQPTDSAASAR